MAMLKAINTHTSSTQMSIMAKAYWAIVSACLLLAMDLSFVQAPSEQEASHCSSFALQSSWGTSSAMQGSQIWRIGQNCRYSIDGVDCTATWCSRRSHNRLRSRHLFPDGNYTSCQRIDDEQPIWLGRCKLVHHFPKNHTILCTLHMLDS